MSMIFSENGFSQKEVDYFSAEEYEPAKENMMSVSRISFEEISKGHKILGLDEFPQTLKEAGGKVGCSNPINFDCCQIS